MINDWYVDGTIDGQYPSRCYREALSRVQEQQRIYSDLPEKLDRGLTAALRRQATGGVLNARHIASGGSKASGPIQRVLGELGPARADSVPIPLLVLAGFALLLIAAGATSAVHRRLAGRRISSD
ncbi:MAG: hypothetical protein H0W87_10405 [Actinobacteria bacterium]|nr:hypothetical protein [Actinomycetota bacterium]